MKREPLLTDVIGLAVGLGMIALAFSRLGNQIPYEAGDVRGDPWFNTVFTAVFVVAGLAAAAVATLRVAQGLRARRR